MSVSLLKLIAAQRLLADNWPKEIVVRACLPWEKQGAPATVQERRQQTNQPGVLVPRVTFLGDKLGTALPVQEQRAYNANEGLHRL